ncbi:MAG: HPF/RaiA family ribosome-associated protein [Alphaproteobacteria bacterium]|jgi:ribosome-associated translation inhibitor RaiA|nr:HPF/RaiA family ribosome-associated protein [Alphaproteobacteria bacterium]
MFVQINTDNQIVTDAEANERLEQRVRDKLGRFEQRLTHVEIHVSDVNGPRHSDSDKRVSLEARPNGHQPIAVHAEGARIDDAVTTAANKAARALDHLFGKLADRTRH